MLYHMKHGSGVLDKSNYVQLSTQLSEDPTAECLASTVECLANT